MNDLEPRKVISLLFIVAIAAVFVLQFGPGSSGFSRTGPTQGAGPSAAAVVNGKEIPLLAYRMQYARQLDNYRRQGFSFTPEQARSIGLPTQVLDGMVDRELLSQAAEHHGLVPSDDELLKIIQKNTDFHKDGQFDFPTYQQVLRDYYRKTAPEYEAELRKELAAIHMMEFVRNGVAVSDEEVRNRFEKENNQAKLAFARFLPTMYADKVAQPSAAELEAYKKAHEKELEDYFKANSALYNQPERARVRRLLVKLDPAATEEQKAAARTRAESLHKELQGGKDFAELARAQSDDEASKANGGDLGWVERSSLEPQLAEAVFALEAGALSAPVETPSGLHLVKVEEKKAKVEKQLAEVSDEIARTLYKRDKAKELAKAEADKTLAALKQGKALATLLPPEKAGEPALKRMETETKPEAVETDLFNSAAGSVPYLGADQALLGAVFATTQPQVLDQVFSVGEGFVVAQVTERKLADEATWESKKDEVRKQVQQSREYEVSQSYLEALRKGGKVDKSEEAITVVSGG